MISLSEYHSCFSPFYKLVSFYHNDWFPQKYFDYEWKQFFCITILFIILFWNNLHWNKLLFWNNIIWNNLLFWNNFLWNNFCWNQFLFQNSFCLCIFLIIWVQTKFSFWFFNPLWTKILIRKSWWIVSLWLLQTTFCDLWTFWKVAKL